MKPVIICGGIGSKMWPMSRSSMPKHFLPLVDGKSLFEINWEVLRKKFGPEEIYLQTNAVQAEIAKKIVPEIIPENIFIEPEMRNQGPATGFAAAQLIKNGFGDEPFMLIQADLLRLPEEKFLEMIDVCDDLVRKENKYITGGVKPKYAILGIDYMIAGKQVTENGMKVFEVDSFLPREEKEKVEGYVQDGVAMAHWNHTCITPNRLMEMFKKYKMDWYEPLMAIVNGGDVVQNYAAMPKGPIEDVTKNAFNNGEALVVELPFECVDFGTWESVDKYLKEKGQYTEENTINIESKDNFIKAPKGKTVATIGVEGLVIIDTGDALLVMKRGDSGKVGQVVDKLKEENKTELL
jgi:mannose-1-phosphate guanylyltransferase